MSAETSVTPRGHLLLTRIAGALGLVGLAFTAWFFVSGSTLSFVLFAFFGAGCLGAGGLLYAVVVLRELRAKRIL